jgi:glutathione S-transferase
MPHIFLEELGVPFQLCLADTHPQAGLLPALGSQERAQAYKWLTWSRPSTSR